MHEMMRCWLSVAPEKVACIDFAFHIIQTGIITIGDNGIALLFELAKIVHNLAAEKSSTVFECGFIDDDGGTFGLDPFHDALD